MKKLILTNLIALMTAVILMPKPAEARCPCHCDGCIDIYFWDCDCWDCDCWDCCCCGYWEFEWWLFPHWEWHPCCRRIIDIYYSPCGWYRYVYYDHPCHGCERVFVQNRWVYRQSIHLERRYTYNDRATDFARRRGLDTRYRSSTSPTVSNRQQPRESNDGLYRTGSSSSNDSRHRTKQSVSENRSNSDSRSYERSHRGKQSTAKASSDRVKSGTSSAKSGSRTRSK